MQQTLSISINDSCYRNDGQSHDRMKRHADVADTETRE